jgi:hypothetical protein
VKAIVQVVVLLLADELISYAKSILNLKLIILDPLSCFRGGKEIDDVSAKQIVLLMRRLVRETGACVIALHHVNKNSISSNDEPNQNASRGSSALTDGVRWQMNMVTMSAEEAKNYGLSDLERRLHAKLAITKSNYAPPGSHVWIKNDLESQVWRGGVGLALRTKEERGDSGLLELIKAQLRARKRKGETWSPDGFAEAFQGKDGPLKASKRKIIQVIRQAVDDGEIEELPNPDPDTKRTKKSILVVLLDDDETEEEYARQSNGG